jgi:hypothetical protein
MKIRVALAGLLLVGCAGASKEPLPSMTAASVPGPQAPASAPKEEAAPPEQSDSRAKASAKAADSDADNLPKIVFTPKGELRNITRAKLEAAMKAVKKETTPQGATATLSAALGKPTWIEDETTRIWVATDTAQCVRLILQEDGSVDFEVGRSTESKRLSPTARQNLCTGKIEPIDNDP